MEIAHLNPTEQTFEELDYRENDGIEVSLLWHRAAGDLSIFVTDRRTKDAFEFSVRADEAKDAFVHPYAYATFRRRPARFLRAAA